MNRMFTVLIAEDDDGNFLLTKKSLQRWGLSNPIIRFTEGDSLLQFLKAALPDNNTPKLNYLILLDLYMPGTDGFQTLRQIKHSPLLKYIPTAILTTIDDPDIIERCRSLGADTYFKKPLKQDDFITFLNKYYPSHELQTQTSIPKIQIKTTEPTQKQQTPQPNTYPH